MVLEHGLRRCLQIDDSDQPPTPSLHLFVEESIRSLPNAEEISQCEGLVRNYAQASSSATKATFEKGDTAAMIGCIETYVQNIQGKLEQFQWLEDEYLSIRSGVSSTSCRTRIVAEMRAELQAAGRLLFRWNETVAVRLPALIQHLSAAYSTGDPQASLARESILMQQQQFMQSNQNFERLIWLAETVVGEYDLRVDPIIETSRVQAVENFEAAVTRLSEAVSHINQEQVKALIRCLTDSSPHPQLILIIRLWAGRAGKSPDGA